MAAGTVEQVDLESDLIGDRGRTLFNLGNGYGASDVDPLPIAADQLTGCGVVVVEDVHRPAPQP